MGALVELAWFRLRDPMHPNLAELAGMSGPQAARRGPRIGRGEAVTQVRGVLAERVIVSSELDPFMSIKALARYSGLSERNLRNRLTDPTHPLPCYRIGAKPLVRRSDYDAWAARYRRVGDPDLDRVVAEALRDLRSGPKPRRAERVA